MIIYYTSSFARCSPMFMYGTRTNFGVGIRSYIHTRAPVRLQLIMYNTRIKSIIKTDIEEDNIILFF